MPEGLMPHRYGGNELEAYILVDVDLSPSSLAAREQLLSCESASEPRGQCDVVLSTHGGPEREFPQMALPAAEVPLPFVAKNRLLEYKPQFCGNMDDA